MVKVSFNNSIPRETRLPSRESVKHKVGGERLKVLASKQVGQRDGTF